MNMATTSLSGFIPVVPPSVESSSSRCRRCHRHFYADVFGVAYGFPSKGDRDAFVACTPPARVLDGHKLNVHGEISRYRFVVVCRSSGHAVRLYRLFVDALVR